MNGLPRHPGTEEIAEFRAGITDGARGDLVAAHLAECLDCSSVSARLERLPLILAAFPQPALPASVEARVMAALAAESRRIAPDGTAGRLIEVGPASAAPGTRLPGLPGLPEGGPPPWFTRQRRILIAPLGVLIAAAACLLLAFVGLRLSGQGHPGGPAAGGRATPARERVSAGGIAGPRENSTSPVLRERPFPVLVSSANLQGPTLQAQVRHQLTVGPGADNQVTPPRTLVGCVDQLTAGSRLTLVEEATYQSRPVYVIATRNRAWVVGRACTPAHPAVLASVALSPGR
ncbi:MAG: hypothetical protein FWE35_07690 [Streptosporangiales bacterium]|nr:hypothetical protein [Streptosporangiales bacterium]